MLEGDLIFSLISLAAGTLCLSVGVYVFWKNPYLYVSQVFIVAMSLAAISGVLDFLFVTAPDPEAAMALGRLSLFMSVTVFGALLYLSHFLPYERKEAWVPRNREHYALAVFLTALVPAVVLDSLSEDGFGFWIAPSAAGVMWAAIVLIYASWAVYILTRACITSGNREAQRRCTTLAFGISVPALYGILVLTTHASEVELPHMASAGFVVTGLVFAVAVLRHKLFIVEPVEESISPDLDRIPAVKVEGGHCDLVVGKRPDLAYRIFVSEVASGGHGLLISRIHPDQVRERYGLVKTPVIWLSSQPGADRVDPGALSILQHTIVDFLQKGQDAVILLDGLEYLVANNPVDKVLRLVYTIHDAVVISGSKFIVPLDPDVLDPRNLALFEREFEIVLGDQ